MATEAKSIDMTETELRHKLFDDLIEDYLTGGGVSSGYEKRLHKIPIDTLNKSEFLFGCKGRIERSSQCWFFYFVDKVVILWFQTENVNYIYVNGYNVPNIYDSIKVIKYGSTLNCISLNDVSKIVFEYQDINQIVPTTTETIDYSELRLDFNKNYNVNSWSGYNPVKWFNSDRFQFLALHMMNSYSSDYGSLRSFNIYGILRTITSHIQKLIQKNEQNKQNEESKREQTQLEEKVSNHVSQISDMNEIILRMQSQIEQQSKIILEQQSKIEGMKKIMTNMLREQQSTKSVIETMQRQIEEQCKMNEYNKRIDKSLDHSTLESDIEKILNGDM